MNWSTVRTLIRLRYQLLWAQARTSNGKYALLVVLYVIGVSVFLFLSLGGFGAAVTAIYLGRGEQIARWILTGIFLNGLIVGVLLGIGPKNAFSDEMLRRFPMTALGRLATRHLIGLLDPIWPLMMAILLGLAVGFALANPWRILIGLPIVVLYIAICYLTAAALLAVINRLLQHRGGGLALSALMFVLITGAIFIRPVAVDSHGREWGQVADQVLRCLPPEIAASLLSGVRFNTGAFDVALLLVWGTLFFWVLASLERRSPVAQSDRRLRISWENPYDKVASWFGPALGPLVAKSLRYHLRCNRVRLGLALAVSFLVIFPRVFSPVTHHVDLNGLRFLLTLVLFFMGSCSGTFVMTVNQFGYDGAGIQRYPTFPVPFSRALCAASIASLVLGYSVILVALVAWIVLSGFSFDVRMPLMLILAGTSGLFLFNAEGVWTTVLFPRSCNFQSVFGNQLSLGGNVAMFSQIVITVIPLTFVISGVIKAEHVLSRWWVLVLFSVLCVGLYVVTLRLVDGVLKSRRERLMRVTAGAPSN